MLETKAKWAGQLSTTEPFNNLGLIKVRQNNKDSETFEFQITENGQPFDLTGMDLYFNTKFNRFNTVQQRATVVDAKKGIIRYTLNDYDMQLSNPFQPAYFEFRKGDRYVGSTQTFFYHIVKSIYQECTDSSTYIIRLEELFKIFQDFFNTQSQDWAEFVEANREILESIDPGGMILTELVDARHSSLTDIKHKRLEDRLYALDDEFRDRGVNVKWFGAKGDGATDDTTAINNAIKFANKNEIKKVVINSGIFLIKAHVDKQTTGNYLQNDGGIEILDNIKLIISSGATLKAIPNDKKAYNIIRIHRKENWEILVNGRITGDNDSHLGTQGEWGYGISIQGCFNFKISGNGLIDNCWGDGINLQRANRLGVETNGYYPENGIISGITSDKNGRQGMSIEEGKNIYVKDATFSNTKRTAPEYGICIEPAWRNKIDEPVCEDITIDNCKILGNKGGGITTVGTTIDNNIQLKKIVVKNCYFEDNGENTTLKTSVAISANRSDILIKDCIFKTNQSVYISSCRYVDIFDSDMLNGTIMVLSDDTDKYSIRTALNIFNNKIRIVNSKTNSYSSVIFTALKGNIVNIVDNDIFYNDANAVLIKNTGDTNSNTKEVFCLGNRLVGGSISIQHQFIDVYKAISNTIVKASSQAFNSNGYEVYFKSNDIVDCQKGVFLFCNNDKESYCEISNNNFDVKDKMVLSNYQANKLFTLFNLDNKISKNIQFMDATNGNPLSDESTIDLHMPKIVTLKNQDKSQNVPIGTMFLDLDTGWIMYKSYNGLHRVTTTKI